MNSAYNSIRDMTASIWDSALQSSFVDNPFSRSCSLLNEVETLFSNIVVSDSGVAHSRNRFKSSFVFRFRMDIFSSSSTLLAKHWDSNTNFSIFLECDWITSWRGTLKSLWILIFPPEIERL